MEVIGGIVLAAILTLILAAVGVTTLAAFVLMAGFWLITNWTFRRIFTVSFLLALLAPIMLGAAISSAFADGSLERELRAGMSEVFPNSEQISQSWQEIGPRIEEVQRDLEAGEIEREEARQRIEQVITEQTGVQINLEGINVTDDDGRLRIETE